MPDNLASHFRHQRLIRAADAVARALERHSRSMIKVAIFFGDKPGRAYVRNLKLVAAYRAARSERTMKPTTTKKAGETASYGGRGKRQYYAGKKSFIKRRAAKAARRESETDRWKPGHPDYGFLTG